MHRQAYEWVARFATSDPLRVLDIGGRDINGSCRPLFPAADYVSLDIQAGQGVDIVADAATWNPDRVYDVVVCTEVFEHAPDWRRIIQTSWRALRKDGGQLVLTMAGPGRQPHSAFDGGPLRPGEHYENIDPDELLDILDDFWFTDVVVDQFGADVRAYAVREA